MISEEMRASLFVVETHVPLVEWQECIDVVLDSIDSPFDGECAVHDGCRSII